ncbi:MAG: minor capsid protein [Weissella confusa]|nr:minor capsid protein [Weissella confusa]
MKNDFIERLADKVNSIVDLGLTAKLDYLSDDESLVIYSMPGGNVEQTYMDGARDVSLPFEIAIKTKRQHLANDTLWVINDELSDFDIQISSANYSYEFGSLDVAKPFLNDQDEQGYYVYMLDVTAHITVQKEN